MNNEINYSKGDMRYFAEVGTTTVNTTTGVALSSTVAKGALWHTMQLNGLTFVTTTAYFTAQYQGTIERGIPSASTAWFNVGSPLTVTNTTPVFMSVTTAIMSYARVNITANTSPVSFNVLMQGNR